MCTPNNKDAQMSLDYFYKYFTILMSVFKYFYCNFYVGIGMFFDDLEKNIPPTTVWVFLVMQLDV